MSGLVRAAAWWMRVELLGVAVGCAVGLAGCAAGQGDVATLRTAQASVSAPAPSVSLDQHGRAQALEACLVEAGLPAQLTPVDGGDAQIDWAEGHEVLSRDFDQWSTIVPGPGGVVDPVTHEAFLDGGESPALWVDGQDHTEAWVGCLEGSGYTAPDAHLEEDPGEVAVWNQRLAEAANEWIACARENGMPGLADAAPDGDTSGYGPHAEVPLDTDPELLRTVIDACPNFNEEVLRRQVEGDVTLEDEIREGEILPNPFVLVEEPEGMQEEGFDFEGSEEYQRRTELLSIVLEAEQEFAERYGREQALEDDSAEADPADS